MNLNMNLFLESYRRIFENVMYVKDFTDTSAHSFRISVLINKIKNKEKITFEINKNKIDKYIDEFILNFIDNSQGDGDKFKKGLETYSTYVKGRVKVNYTYPLIVGDKPFNSQDILDNNFEVFNFNNLFKSKDFGGDSAAKGGGNFAEKFGEPITALCIAYNLDDKVLLEMNNIDSEAENIIKELNKNAFTDYKITKDDIINSSEDWKRTYAETANTFRNYVGGNKYKIYHRYTKEIDLVYKTMKSLMKKDEELSTLLSRGIEDKWNPGDIWAISDASFFNKLNSFNTFEELNSYLKDKFNNKEIIPISLKQVSKNGTKIHIFKSEQERVKFNSLSLIGKGSTKNKDMWNSNYLVAHFDKGLMIFKAFGTFTSFSGEIEIKGTNARHGKVGLPSIQYYIKKICGKTIKVPKTKQKREYYINELWKEIQDIPLNELGFDKLDKQSFYREGLTKGESWLWSKLLSIYIYKAINKCKKDELFKHLYSYAKSELDISSPYIKIY